MEDHRGIVRIQPYRDDRNVAIGSRPVWDDANRESNRREMRGSAEAPLPPPVATMADVQSSMMLTWLELRLTAQSLWTGR
jgi:hypothetical protein